MQHFSHVLKSTNMLMLQISEATGYNFKELEPCTVIVQIVSRNR